MMRRPNLDALPEIPALPAGYALRSAAPEDAVALAGLLQSAFPDEVWTPERVSSVLLEAPDVEETYLITNGAAARRDGFRPHRAGISPNPAICTGSPWRRTRRDKNLAF